MSKTSVAPADISTLDSTFTSMLSTLGIAPELLMKQMNGFGEYLAEYLKSSKHPNVDDATQGYFKSVLATPDSASSSIISKGLKDEKPSTSPANWYSSFSSIVGGASGHAFETFEQMKKSAFSSVQQISDLAAKAGVTKAFDFSKGTAGILGAFPRATFAEKALMMGSVLSLAAADCVGSRCPSISVSATQGQDQLQTFSSQPSVEASATPTLTQSQTITMMMSEIVANISNSSIWNGTNTSASSLRGADAAAGGGDAGLSTAAISGIVVGGLVAVTACCIYSALNRDKPRGSGASFHPPVSSGAGGAIVEYRATAPTAGRGGVGGGRT